MKESRNREKERKYKEKEVNLYIFNEKCTFFRKKLSMTKKKKGQNFFRELKGKDFFLKIYFPKIFAPPIFVTQIFAPPIFVTSLRPCLVPMSFITNASLWCTILASIIAKRRRG